MVLVGDLVAPVAEAEAPSTTDGPFTESKDVIGGDARAEASSMADAVAHTRRFLLLHGDEREAALSRRQVRT